MNTETLHATNILHRATTYTITVYSISYFCTIYT